MTFTLAHVFFLVAAIDFAVVWALTRKWRDEDDRLPEEKRRPAGLVLAAGALASAGLVAFAFLHPLGDMPIL